MKTLKIGMFAAALLLIFAGCKNAVAPTPYSESEFAKNADIYPSLGSSMNSFKITRVTLGDNYVGDANESKLVTIEFNKKLNEKGLGLDGIEFSSLTNGTDADKMYSKTYINARLIKVLDKKAYYKVPLKDVKDLYIYFTAKLVKDKHGIPLNQDDDLTAGEAGDDDYAYYQTIDGMTGLDPLKGNKDFPKKTNDDNVTLKSAITFAVSFNKGTNADEKLVKKVAVNGTRLLGLFKSTEKDGVLENVKNSLGTYLKIETYDWKANKWEPITTDFKINSTKNGWESAIAVEPHRAIRARWVQLDKLELKSANYAYKLKYSLKDDEAREVIASTVTNESGFVSLADGYVLDSSKLNTCFTVDKTTNGKVKFTLNISGFESLFNNVFFDKTSSTWKKLVFNNTDPSKPSLFKGFDKDTLIKDNFKFVSAIGELIEVKGIDYQITGTDATYPNALVEFTFKFVKEDIKASSVFVSPNVKIAAFTGSINSTTDKFEFPALPILNIKSDSDCIAMGLKGWSKF